MSMDRIGTYRRSRPAASGARSTNADDRAEIVRLAALEREATAPYQRMLQRLEEQWQADNADFVDRLKATIRTEAARHHPGVVVEFPGLPAGGSADVEYSFEP